LQEVEQGASFAELSGDEEDVGEREDGNETSVGPSDGSGSEKGMTMVEGKGKGKGEEETPQGPAAALTEVGGGGEGPEDDATPVTMGGEEENLNETLVRTLIQRSIWS
jgi:hypothetical protein